MAQIDVYNKERGVTYVYESVSYWDKDLKQPRSKRKLIGKRDADGNLVPTGSRGRKRSEAAPVESASHSDTNTPEKIQNCIDMLQEKDALIQSLRQQLAEAQQENRSLRNAISQSSTLFAKVLQGRV